MKSRKTIWAHTLICNEENYLWFSVMSVIDHVDKMLLWDTGSTDNTLKIIEEIKKIKRGKINFREVGKVDIHQFTRTRQQMLDQTNSDWLLVLDGDEVWWEDSIKNVVKTIQKDGDKLESIVTPFYNIIGDIYHYQEEAAGMYEIDDKKGHYNIRAINREIPGLAFAKPYGQESLYDESNILIQDRSQKYRKFLNSYYLHFTNLARSSDDQKVIKRAFKLKYEIGKKFPANFKYPEVFYKARPKIVPSPWRKMKFNFFLMSALQTIPRKVKRRLIKSKSGY